MRILAVSVISVSLHVLLRLHRAVIESTSLCQGHLILISILVAVNKSLVLTLVVNECCLRFLLQHQFSLAVKRATNTHAQTFYVS